MCLGMSLHVHVHVVEHGVSLIPVFALPPQGKLSDVYGRKNLLLLSYLIPALGYVTLAMATSYQSLALLLLSKLPTGVSRGASLV